MGAAYDFTWDMLGIVLNCSMILSFVFLILAFIVIVCCAIKDLKNNL